MGIYQHHSLVFTRMVIGTKSPTFHYISIFWVLIIMMQTVVTRIGVV